MKKLVPLIIALVLLLLIVPASYAAPPADGGDGSCYHTVQYGETLFSIGRLYGVNPYQIARVNGLQNPNYIYAGQVLYIPSGQGYTPPTYGNKYPHHHRNPNQGGNYPPPDYGHGYDYSGYYYYSYSPNYQRYSYTCGYYYNCY